MITDKQQRTFDLLKVMLDEKGYPPTVREMAVRLNVTPATIQQSLNHLVKAGLVSRSAGAARSLQVIE